MMNQRTSKRTALYIVYGRRSGENQRGNSSEERQMDMEHYQKRAEELGLPFRAVFDDEKSGFFGDNLEAELGKIFADIHDGTLPKGCVIGTEAHHRIGRLKPGEALLQYLEILKLGIKLDIKGKALRTWENINGITGIGTLTEDFIEMFMAHKHSADLQRVEREANRIKRKAVREGRTGGTMKKGGPGWFVGNRCPAWLTALDAPEIWIDGKPYLYRVDEEMARIIRMVFDWAEQGIGTVRIARRLDDMGFAPFGNSHRKKPEKMIAGWSAGMVGASILKNIAVIGLWQPHTRIREREIEDGDGGTTTERLPYSTKIKDGDPQPYYPAIITPGQFRRVRDGLRERKRADGNAHAGGGRTGKGFGNIIRKLCTCAICGGKVNLWSGSTTDRKDGRVPKYLRCENSRRKTGTRCANTRGFLYERFEAVLFGQLLTAKLIPVLRDMIPRADRDDLLERRIGDVESKIEDAEKSIARLIRRAGATDDDEIAATYERDAKAIRVERDKHAVELDRLRQQRVNQATRVEDKIAEVMARLRATDDLDVSEAARTQLNQLLKSYAKFVLHDRRIVVHIIGHSGLMPVEATLTVEDGLTGLRVMDQDGTVLTDYDGAALALLEPIKAA